MLGFSFLIIIVGLLFRWLGTFVVTAPCIKGNEFTVKERSFMAFALLPKDTVLASIGGAVLTKANAIDENIAGKEVKEAFVDYGQKILTTAVIAIVFTAPLGAVLINTLSSKWLSHDGKKRNFSQEFAANEQGGNHQAVIDKLSLRLGGKKGGKGAGTLQLPSGHKEMAHVLHKLTSKVKKIYLEKKGYKRE